MDPLLTTPLTILLMIPILVLIADGAGLVGGSVLVHRLGLPIGSGAINLRAPLPPGCALTTAAHGISGVWLDEHTIGYWSGRSRFGFRDSLGIQALRGMGIVCSGTLHIRPDRRSGVFIERLRLAPLVLIGCVSTGVMALWAYAAVLPGLLPVVPLFFSGVYCLFAVISIRHMRAGRGHLEHHQGA